MRHKSLNSRFQATFEERARFMRRETTLSETLLWQRLRGRKLGVVFRRQVVIGRYIVDFCAPAIRLGGRSGWRLPQASSLPRRKAGPCLGARRVSRAARERPGGGYGH